MSKKNVGKRILGFVIDIAGKALIIFILILLLLYWGSMPKKLTPKEQCEHKMYVIHSNIRVYCSYAREYPWSLIDLFSLPKRSLQGEWKGPYLDGSPEVELIDPWSNPLIMYYNSRSDELRLFSYGPDGKALTKDDIQIGMHKESFSLDAELYLDEPPQLPPDTIFYNSQPRKL
ncbi:MAG: type II secretion system protein GspG [Candidatus Wallbacteria bacterium]|nr:type II secretion system protein GspG [Candidatus Wallbacteria bacterium]